MKHPPCISPRTDAAARGSLDQFARSRRELAQVQARHVADDRHEQPASVSTAMPMSMLLRQAMPSSVHRRRGADASGARPRRASRGGPCTTAPDRVAGRLELLAELTRFVASTVVVSVTGAVSRGSRRDGRRSCVGPESAGRGAIRTVAHRVRGRGRHGRSRQPSSRRSPIRPRLGGPGEKPFVEFGP